MKKKTVEIPEIVYTSLFLKFVEYYTEEFKKYKGYGKYWLKEWTRMGKKGLFKPEKLRELYVKILDGSGVLSHAQWEVVYCICTQALDAAKAFASANSFDVRVITGEVAVNDDDEELTGLSMEEAINICNAMNEEAEELLFRVYNSSTNKIIK